MVYFQKNEAQKLYYLSEQLDSLRQNQNSLSPHPSFENFLFFYYIRVLHRTKQGTLWKVKIKFSWELENNILPLRAAAGPG